MTVDPLLHVAVAAAEAVGLTWEQITSYDRRHDTARRRRAAWAGFREATGASYPHIADLFNRADHTTILYALRRAAASEDAIDLRMVDDARAAADRARWVNP